METIVQCVILEDRILLTDFGFVIVDESNTSGMQIVSYLLGIRQSMVFVYEFDETIQNLSPSHVTASDRAVQH